MNLTPDPLLEYPPINTVDISLYWCFHQDMDQHTATARRLTPILKALADENRLAMLLAIAERERTVRELVEMTGLSQTLVSHHLKALRDTSLVSVTPRGRSNVYSLCCDALADPFEQLVRLTSPIATASV